jgi:hypothetical protein
MLKLADRFSELLEKSLYSNCTYLIENAFSGTNVSFWALEIFFGELLIIGPSLAD